MTTHTDPMNAPAAPAPHAPEVLAAMIRKRADGELELHQVQTVDDLPADSGYFRLGLLRAAEIIDGLTAPQWRPGMVGIRRARSGDAGDSVIVCREDRTGRGIALTEVPLTYLDGSVKGHAVGSSSWHNEAVDRVDAPRLADCQVIWPVEPLADAEVVDERPVPAIPRVVVRALVKALDELPRGCRYHLGQIKGDDPRRFSGACCATGEPAYLRRITVEHLTALGVIS